LIHLFLLFFLESKAHGSLTRLPMILSGHPTLCTPTQHGYNVPKHRPNKCASTHFKTSLSSSPMKLSNICTSFCISLHCCHTNHCAVNTATNSLTRPLIASFALPSTPSCPRY
jgi:hypothetical protein